MPSSLPQPACQTFFKGLELTPPTWCHRFAFRHPLCASWILWYTMDFQIFKPGHRIVYHGISVTYLYKLHLDTNIYLSRWWMSIQDRFLKYFTLARHSRHTRQPRVIFTVPMETCDRLIVDCIGYWPDSMIMIYTSTNGIYCTLVLVLSSLYLSGDEVCQPITERWARNSILKCHHSP